MGSLEQLYQQVILDYTRKKHGAEDPSGMDAPSHQMNPTYGDEVTLGITLNGERLTSLQQGGNGCSVSHTSLSMITGLTQGKSAEEIGHLYRDVEVVMHSRNRGVDGEILGGPGDATAFESTSQFTNHVECAFLRWYVLCDTMAKSGIDTSTAGEPAEQ